MFYVYVLYSKSDKNFYIGFTTKLKRRLDEHKYGKVYSTSRREELELIFYEAYLYEQDAKKREEYFKTTKGKRTLRLMLGNTLQKLVPGSSNGRTYGSGP